MASVAVDPADPLALHKLVFLNKVHTLKMYLAPYKASHHPSHTHANDISSHPSQAQEKQQQGTSSQDEKAKPLHHPSINTMDNHFHTPLHLAVMLNRKDMVGILLKAGANPVARSGSGWTPRQEATSLGNRELIEMLTRYQRKEFSGSFKTKAMNLVKQLSTDLDQFYFQLQWEFQSWVPFVSGLCPNDTYHIWKKGNCVRMDTSLVGFENLKWIRGHISIIFRVDPESGPELVVVDRIKKITQRLAKSSDDDHKQDYEPTDEEIEEEVSTCFNSEITSTNVPTSAIKFQRAKTGLWGYRTNKVEKVGEFDCAVWKMDGVEFRTRVRSEHLRDETGKPIQALKRMSHGHGGHKHQVPHQRHHQHEGAIEASGHVESGEPEKGVVLKFGADRAEKRGGRGAQPRRPIHQPLFSPFAAEPESESNRGEAIVGDENQTKQQVSFTAPGSNTTGAPGEGAALSIPKKHTRSTGTISDDAFFETALQEAEGEMNEGDESEDEDQDPQVMYRESLTPPPATRVTFEEYFDPSKQGELHLGRPLEQKESRKTFGATLWMYDSNNSSKTGSGSSTLHENSSQASIGASSVASSQGSLFGNKAQTQAPQFPLTIEKILPLLEVVGMDNNRLVGKLKEFLEFQLPPGFPIRANIPVYPSLSADVTFVNYDAQRIIEDEMFEIPGESQGYAEGFIIRRGGEDDT